jgi:hypothetical protein
VVGGRDSVLRPCNSGIRAIVDGDVSISIIVGVDTPASSRCNIGRVVDDDVPFTFRLGVELDPPRYPAAIPLGCPPLPVRVVPELIVPAADTTMIEFAAAATVAD